MITNTRFGQGLQSFGRKRPLEVYPGTQHVRSSSFAAAYEARDIPQDVPRDSSPYALDMEVTAKDELRRLPGLDLLETFATRTPEQLVLHSKLDQTADLLLFDAPYIGVWDGSAPVVWTDESIAVGKYAWTNFAGTLVFSTGATALYARSSAGAVSTIAGGPPAKALATFAGRVFAGHVVDGSTLPMGIKWTGTAGTHTDWTGIGSGSEELISNRLEVDYIQAFHTMGFDLMAIVCRRSIWVGIRSGDSDRPADFQPRIENEGGVSQTGSAVTPYGVAILTDAGVQLFDGNKLQRISDQIRADILPLDADNLSSYSLTYHPGSMRLHLITPTETWVYAFEHQRWYRSTLVAQSLAPLGTAQDSADLFILGTDHVGRSALGKQEQGSIRYLSRNQSPLWEIPWERGDHDTQLVTTKELHISHRGDSGTVEIWQPDENGDFRLTVTKDLTAVSGRNPHITSVGINKTGLGLALQVRITQGDPLIGGFAADIVMRGPRRDSVSRHQTLVPVQVSGDFIVFLPYDAVSGLDLWAFDDGAGDYLVLSDADSGDYDMREQPSGFVTLHEV